MAEVRTRAKAGPKAKKGFSDVTRRRTPKSRKVKKAAPQGHKATREMLLKMRSEILSQALEEPAVGSEVAVKEAEDEADLASNETSRQLLLLLSDRNRAKVLAIERALERLAEKTYGKCEECGSRIEPGRLKALPLATLCVDCQSQIEQEMKFHKGREEGDEGLPLRSGEDEAD